MAKRKGRAESDREITTEILGELLSASYIGTPTRRKVATRRTLATDTGIVGQEFESATFASRPDDIGTLAAIAAQAAVCGLTAINAPDWLKSSIKLNPRTAADTIASLLLEKSQTNGQERAGDGEVIAFCPNVAGRHRHQDAQTISALRNLGVEGLVKLRDEAMILATLLELRSAVLQKRWPYVAACAYQVGRYVERVKCRQHERHAFDARIRKPRAMKAGKRSADQIYAETKKAKALALFDSLIAAGKMVKAATAAVEREFDIPGRTLREWRRARNKSVATH